MKEDNSPHVNPIQSCEIGERDFVNDDEIPLQQHSDSEDSSSSDSDSEYEKMIEILQKAKGDRKTWAFKADMISDFERDPELCMNAVCALYRQQSRKGSLCVSLMLGAGGLHGNVWCVCARAHVYYLLICIQLCSFILVELVKGTILVEYLTDGDPEGKLKRSVSELQQFDPNGVEDCRKLAQRYSTQLFQIHRAKEDPFFLPP
ncbi:hypothetical protein Acr_15g0000950 [Actinidia rufa]|uniref:Uncharacterized protein n=1 Tax=Actinidia rufa TaxID=165716 RepID=A0A7J0FRZ5_9ERIC|nr:hypothetical protein Acr_15g0000950 [Actinidia rufa]